jgi:hypothetical protein
MHEMEVEEQVFALIKFALWLEEDYAVKHVLQKRMPEQV